MKVALIGKSKAVKRINQQVMKLTAKQDDILIHGERGTGKSIVGKNIHYESVDGNENSPLIELKLNNLNEIPFPELSSGENLNAIPGNGTILIEEIENAGFRNQMKLAHFLKTLNDIRNSENDTTNVRVIITTNDDPVRLSEKSEIIPGLAEHLADFSTIEIPPLRERKEDIPHLVEHFMCEACKRIGVEEPVLDINAISILIEQPWKNNVRELRSVIERSVVFSTNGMFTLPQDIIGEESKVTRMLKSILSGEGQELDGSLDTIERGLIDSALKRFEFNFSEAAHFLGMNQKTLEYRAGQLGLVQSKK